MGDSLTPRFRPFRAFLWTILFVAIIFAIDRGVQGPLLKSGWIVAQQLSDIPSKAGKSIIPPYLPKTVAWPPQKIFYRVSPTPGQWFGCQGLWLGFGNSPLPDALRMYSGCFDEKSSCPDGWHLLSTQLTDGRVIHLLTKLEAIEAARILEGLRL